MTSQDDGDSPLQQWLYISKTGLEFLDSMHDYHIAGAAVQDKERHGVFSNDSATYVRLYWGREHGLMK